MPTTNDVTSITTVPGMMWILTDKNEIFVRRGISEQTPFGWTWEQLHAQHVYQIKNSISSFKHGRDVIWAVSSDSKVFAAVADLYPITSETFVLDWIEMKDSALSEMKFVDFGQHLKNFVSEIKEIPAFSTVSEDLLDGKQYIRSVLWLLATVLEEHSNLLKNLRGKLGNDVYEYIWFAKQCQDLLGVCK